MLYGRLFHRIAEDVAKCFLPYDTPLPVVWLAAHWSQISGILSEDKQHQVPLITEGQINVWVYTLRPEGY